MPKQKHLSMSEFLILSALPGSRSGPEIKTQLARLGQPPSGTYSNLTRMAHKGLVSIGRVNGPRSIRTFHPTPLGRDLYKQAVKNVQTAIFLGDQTK